MLGSKKKHGGDVSSFAIQLPFPPQTDAHASQPYAGRTGRLDNLTRSSLGPLPQINLTRQLVENPKSMCYQEMRPLLLQSREAKQPVHEPNLLRWLW